ncbi:protein twisted gastrulation-like [Drosophila tropicalis]|uniref:protein twisted gastrulation-like n=1 Tax=Drosophila tropicalis TaxID=46794 RepID=UPI0035AB7881
MSQYIVYLSLILSWTGTGCLPNDDDCNEMVCGSVVSKCLLTQSCECKLTDCHCCEDCVNCLGELWSECCGCLDMCPKLKNAPMSLSSRSEIKNLEGLPELFDTLTAEDDDQWSTIRFPMRPGFKLRLEGTDTGTEHQHQAGGLLNCTVIYMNSCIRSSKCEQHCESMGASSYRWFHDGCCECVGSNCLNYGINESRCTACPEDLAEDPLTADKVHGEPEQDLDEAFTDDMWDYGENDDFI